MRPQILLFVLIASSAAIAAGTVQSAQSQSMTSGQVTFASGGVGEDSLQRMKALSKDFNLKVIFALKAGNYVSDVAVVISDARGAKVLETVSEGPWFLAKLSPGKYQFTATYESESFTRTMTIPASGRRELIFRWDRAE